jgi:hypothetical protein
LGWSVQDVLLFYYPNCKQLNFQNRILAPRDRIMARNPFENIHSEGKNGDGKLERYEDV